MEKYSSEKTNITDKAELQKQIDEMSIRIRNIDERISDVWQPDPFYSIIPDVVKDAQMELTSEKLADMAVTGKNTVPELAETTLAFAQETDLLDLEQINELADRFKNRSMANVEEQLEDDYNMIDGIINNGSKSENEKDKPKSEPAVGGKAVFFSRNKIQKDAKRISEKAPGKTDRIQSDRKKNDQGLE
jgi:hypothetical protein